MAAALRTVTTAAIATTTTGPQQPSSSGTAPGGKPHVATLPRPPVVALSATSSWRLSAPAQTRVAMGTAAGGERESGTGGVGNSGGGGGGGVATHASTTPRSLCPLLRRCSAHRRHARGCGAGRPSAATAHGGYGARGVRRLQGATPQGCGVTGVRLHRGAASQGCVATGKADGGGCGGHGRQQSRYKSRDKNVRAGRNLASDRPACGDLAGSAVWTVFR